MTTGTHPIPTRYQKVQHFPWLDWYEHPLRVNERRTSHYGRLLVDILESGGLLWFPQVGKPGWAAFTLAQRFSLSSCRDEDWETANLPFAGVFYVPQKWGLGWVSVAEPKQQKELSCGCPGPLVVVTVRNDTERDSKLPDMYCVLHEPTLQRQLFEEMKNIDLVGKGPGQASGTPVLLDNQEYDLLYSAGAMVRPGTTRVYSADDGWETWSDKPDVSARFVDGDGTTRVWISADNFYDVINKTYYIRRKDGVVASINNYPGGTEHYGDFFEHTATYVLSRNNRTVKASPMQITQKARAAV